MDLPWLKPVISSWQSAIQQGRSPHAVLLSGPGGSGKRVMAAWLARLHLGVDDGQGAPTYPLIIPEHADLRWIAPLEDKRTIGIDQIRELVAELSLTSYEGRGKAAVIEPADLMTTNAANSLLKTLEEPPGNALLILIADRPGRLPATIFSRCQRMTIALPTETEGLQWLQGVEPGRNWGKILRDAGLAPLAAIDAVSSLEDTSAMENDFRALAAGSALPLEVAAKWASLDPYFVLDWLGRQVQLCIARVSGAALEARPAPVDDSVLARIDRRNLFCYLDIINRLRGQPSGSFNVQLTLECLLIDWSKGLESMTDAE
jgi:DNA polymerase-3 subunit delta'